MTTELPKKIIALLDKGVSIPCPSAVAIGDEVKTERISAKGTVLYPGTRLAGEKTLIGPGVKIGFESPVTLEDCLLGSGVELKGGFFTRSVFLARSSMGSGAQVRECCLIEEEASGAHTVGLKQTILMPFVTLGSLINFCDCLMAGGTSRKNHSEVGSSYIHFNFTPNQDKATASLIGDVPRGVMLRNAPIFLGGQGGLVGPVRLGYGTVIAAGAVWEDDCPQGGMLLKGSALLSERTHHPGLYREVRRKVANNLFYLGNLAALRQWYVHIRRPFLQGPGGRPRALRGRPGGSRRGHEGAHHAASRPGREDGAIHRHCREGPSGKDESGAPETQAGAPAATGRRRRRGLRVSQMTPSEKANAVIS